MIVKIVPRQGNEENAASIDIHGSFLMGYDGENAIFRYGVLTVPYSKLSALAEGIKKALETVSKRREK